MKMLGSERNVVEKTPWGSLTWIASKAIGNSELQTVGICLIHEGQQNPAHHHPNCEEILYVQKGTILHTYDGESVEMNVGDVITVPAGVKHQAINKGSGDAVLQIVFSTGERKTVGE